ncbi:hypothetical protein [Flavobacterium sp. JAS]|uniref:hypothetical protein n=1 Tax=Flavobacterium sp. JAS TaxID=2897329 RepID=UPI00351D1DC5
MAESGFLIDNHYTSSPICVLARQTLTFGKYVSYHNVWNNTIGCPNGFLLFQELFAKRL